MDTNIIQYIEEIRTLAGNISYLVKKQDYVNAANILSHITSNGNSNKKYLLAMITLQILESPGLLITSIKSIIKDEDLSNVKSKLISQLRYEKLNKICQ